MSFLMVTSSQFRISVQIFCTIKTRKSQKSQECDDPRRQCFCDSWPWPLTWWPQLNGFPGFFVGHFYVKFGDPSCVGFWDIVRKKRQTHRQTEVKPNTPATAIGLGDESDVATMADCEGSWMMRLVGAYACDRACGRGDYEIRRPPSSHSAVLRYVNRSVDALCTLLLLLLLLKPDV